MERVRGRFVVLAVTGSIAVYKMVELARRLTQAGNDDRLWQLRSRCSSATGQRAGALRSLFQNSGVDSAVGRVAVSWRLHFRARAACARLNL